SCDFYKTALAARWNASESTTQLPSTINKDKFIRSIISHPDVDVDTFNIILEFLYCGKVTVAMFSNQLMVKALRDQCLDYCLNFGLSVDNAFEIFVLGERLCRSDVRVNALIKVMDDLPKSLVLTFEPFTAVQRWRIAIAWVKAAQGCDEISIESGIPDDFDVAMAQDFESLVYPYVSILDEYLVSILEVYFKVPSLETRIGASIFQESAILQTNEDIYFDSCSVRERHVFGGYCDSAWEYGSTKQATEAFLFKVNKNDVLTFHLRRTPDRFLGTDTRNVTGTGKSSSCKL
ncbi:hypothetical protein BCR33DRAFT_715398, partial [Rhizoclosmatium globosum]